MKQIKAYSLVKKSNHKAEGNAQHNATTTMLHNGDGCLVSAYFNALYQGQKSSILVFSNQRIFSYTIPGLIKKKVPCCILKCLIFSKMQE